MAKKYLCKNIKVVSYWNGYRPYYVHENGNRELLSVAMPTRELAYAMGREQVKHMNERCNYEVQKA